MRDLNRVPEDKKRKAPSGDPTLKPAPKKADPAADGHQDDGHGH